MKKVYYFSKSKLQYVEIKNFRSRIAFFILVAVMLASVVLCGGFNYLLSVTNSDWTTRSLKKENRILKNKLEEVVNLYKVLDSELDSLITANVDLRLAANLPPISEEVRELGYGGGSFDNNFEFMNLPDASEIRAAYDYIDQLTRKVYFEKTNYEEISARLEENKQLFSSMPAIKPCEGTLAYHGFGKRLHPILNRIRMHEGIDIVTNVGTPVHASGDGRVIFVGYKGGYGLTVEIDHGYGYKTLYAHLSKTHVKKGAKISRGDLIAKSGNTGLSTGPHLHYEVEHNGVKQDPKRFIFDDTSLFN
jgi:murein DD-endopeptidase MepM/ murein hydrolase activator NlpD